MSALSSTSVAAGPSRRASGNVIFMHVDDRPPVAQPVKTLRGRPPKKVVRFETLKIIRRNRSMHAKEVAELKGVAKDLAALVAMHREEETQLRQSLQGRSVFEIVQERRRSLQKEAEEQAHWAARHQETLDKILSRIALMEGGAS